MEGKRRKEGEGNLKSSRSGRARDDVNTSKHDACAGDKPADRATRKQMED